MHRLLPQLLLLSQSAGDFGESHPVQLVFVPPRTAKATLSKPDRTCCAVLCRAAPMQGFRMYSELLRRRIYRPAICLGVTICAVASLMDPLSRSYVAYQTLTRSGFNFGSAVLMSMLSLYGAYSVGALLVALLLCPRLCAAGRIRVCSAQLGGLQSQPGSAAFACMLHSQGYMCGALGAALQTRPRTLLCVSTHAQQCPGIKHEAADRD